ncbi:carboxypeptidase regulatory-like domain-containing protein [uncultured Paludibaculum sp.]|uniref:carboxypeptidase regulatory-like domain-containing protein n=1 Tax=uncultured Paludibaculum sp. TaxID=1765020 RepID=UPI002AABF0A5|nr:carboxypeptidase regulatory-like domain-containing protein [uncultured Paludibaculum sp.]
MRGTRLGGCLAILLAGAPVCVLRAQDYATISGRVRDSNGSMIPRAGLLVWNQETGMSRTGHSDDTGQYTFNSLQPGLYTVSVSAYGFRSLTRTNIRLGVSERASLDVMLQIGRLEESITVSSDEVALPATSGTLRGSVDQRRIEDLPLNGRDITQLVMTQAGVVAGNKSQTEGNGYVVNGSRQNGVHYTLDGGTNTDSYRHQSGVFPNASAIAEVVIDRGNLSAEFGNTVGTVVSVVTRSGTNRLHGSAFDYGRNAALNARDFFAATRDNLKRSQFGGTLGGPIIRRRLFFFGSYQGTRGRAESQLTRQFLPTPANRLGDFSTAPAPIADPAAESPFPGSRIPVNRLSPVSRALLQYIAVPDSPSGERQVSIRERTNEDEYTARIDYDTLAHRITGHVFRRGLESPFSGNTQDLASMFATGVGRSDQPYFHATLGDTWLVSGTMIHSATFTVRHRRTLNDWNSVRLPIDFARAGVHGIAVKDPAAMYVNVSGDFTARPGWNYDKRDRDYHFADSLSWMAGRHEFKAGGELLRLRNHIQNDFRTMGNFDFNGAATGDPMADFLLGEVYQFWQGGGEHKELTGLRTALYVQDSWRVTSRLTLSGGLRWDPILPFRESLGRIQCFVPNEQSERFPKAPRGYLNAGDKRCPQGGFDEYRKSLAPRLGFAWRPGGRALVIRGGAGVFWVPQFTMLYNGFVNSAPFSPQVTRNGVPFDDPYRNATNPFPSSFAPFLPEREVAFSTPMGQFGTFASGFRPGYSEALNLTVEQPFGKSWLGRASYVGNLGRNLSYAYDLNYARYGTGATSSNLQQRRPYGDFASIVVSESGATSSYHALETSVSRRAPAGLVVEANYTWSKAIDENSEDSIPGQSASIAVPYDRRAGRALANFDIAHRLAASWVWPIPGLPMDNRWVRSLSRGWVTGGVATWRGGMPFSVRSGTDRALSGVGQDFADLTANPRLPDGRSKQDVIGRYFDTSAFQLAAAGTFGNAPRNLLRGPGLVNFDLMVARELVLRDRVRSQIRAEFFNLMNHAALGNPYSSLNNAVRFGRIESSGPARVIQLALKVNF